MGSELIFIQECFSLSLSRPRAKMSTSTRSYTPFLAFLAGVITTCVLFAQPQAGIRHSSTNFKRSPVQDIAERAEPWVGSTEVHSYPPTNAVNYDPTLFPSNIGYPGPTPTGAEPALLATAPAYPFTSPAQGLLVVPQEFSSNKFPLLKKWGNLSPWYSNPVGTFGVETGPAAPESCTVTALHLLHRHGARYPTASSKCLTNVSDLRRIKLTRLINMIRFRNCSLLFCYGTLSDRWKLDREWKIGFLK